MSSHTYGGHVAPAGPAIARSAHHGGGASVEIRKFSVGPMDNNVYLMADRGSARALLIDAANDAERILAEVDGLELAGIVTTHGHRDHWQALARVSQATGAPTYLHPGDAAMVPVRADHQIADAMRIEFGDAEVTLIHTPGHTQGSVCVLLEAADRIHLFAGDTLFPGGPGNTFGNAAAFSEVMRSLRQRLFALPDDTWVYPDHGDDTTIGAERAHLGEWERRGW